MSTAIVIERRSLEPFVDAGRAAEFLAMSRKTVLALARKGYLPGHPVGHGVRKAWKFRLSELDHWMQTELISSSDQGRIQERKGFL
ncbi:MAG TPA: helix-turn-helix domain-containing protein [Terriglobales bacterium]|jgi:excisionase family DNA binding protein|nr:helix-turn-helix domain-containing protein [Terriglobales bacterium]